jgi:hypothetical protein
MNLNNRAYIQPIILQYKRGSFGAVPSSLARFILVLIISTALCSGRILFILYIHILSIADDAYE